MSRPLPVYPMTLLLLCGCRSGPEGQPRPAPPPTETSPVEPEEIEVTTDTQIPVPSTGVGNPGDASLRPAETSNSEIMATSLAIGDAIGLGCDGAEIYRIPVNEVLDLLDDDALVGIAPAESTVAICSLQLLPIGPLSLQLEGRGPAEGRSAVLSLDVPEIRVHSEELFQPGMEVWSLELGEPGWLMEVLELEDASPVIDADHPLHPLLADRVIHGSGLYLDADNDGAIDEEDRDHGPVAAGVAREEVMPASLDAIIVSVGDNGRRVASFDGGETWPVDEEDGGPALWSVAAGRGRFVAVGNTGRGLWSTDGREWLDITIADVSLHGITFANDRFVAVGDGGVRAWSYDGLSWNLVSGDPDANLWKIAWGEPGFVASGERGAVAFSPDGLSWTEVPLGGNDLKGIAWNGERYVMVGGGGRRLTSTDGIDWDDYSDADAVIPEDDLYGLAWTGSRFVAASAFKIHHSLDGFVWEEMVLEGPQNLAAGPGYVLATGGDGDRYRSEDGLDWEYLVDDEFGMPLFGIAILPR